jgi:hypothetical protein
LAKNRRTKLSIWTAAQEFAITVIVTITIINRGLFLYQMRALASAYRKQTGRLGFRFRLRFNASCNELARACYRAWLSESAA